MMMKGILSVLFLSTVFMSFGQNTSINWSEPIYGLVDDTAIADSTTFNNLDSTVLATLRWSVDSSGAGTFTPHSSYPDYVYFEEGSFGGMVGSVNMGFDNSIIDTNDAVVMSIQFSQGINGSDFVGVNGLSFTLLDVDQHNQNKNFNWDDNVEVFYNGINAQSFGVLGSCNSLDDEPNIVGFEGGATASDTENCNAAVDETIANIGFEFLNIAVTDITIVYRTGKDFTKSSDPSSQRIGISNLSWTLAPLPVELVKFEGNYNESSNETTLEWETAIELNSDYFEIQMSSDGTNWSPIGTMAGQGTKMEPTKYHFGKSGLESGLHYFRLKQVDLDGQYDFSDIVVIEIQPNIAENVLIFPNPFENKLSIASKSEIQSIQIFNYQGQKIYEYVSGGDTNISIDLGSFVSGFYAANVNTIDGSFSKLILKQ